MKKSIKASRILPILIVIFLITTGSITVFAASGDYYISNILINATIDKQGDMLVEESYDYVFKGSFNGIKRNIKTKNSDGIENVTVDVISNKLVEKGNFELNKADAATEVKIYSKSSSETKTFKINYKVKNVIKKYSDVAELKWLFYSNEDNVDTSKITVYLSLPNLINNEVKYFGEGPKRGSASLDDSNRIKLQLDNMGDGEVIGAQVLFPTNWVNTSKPFSMNREDYNTMKQQQRNKTLAVVGISIFSGIGVISSLLYVNSKKRKKAIAEYRENYMFFNGQYYSQLPSNLSPALVSMLVTNKVGTKDLLSTILHLANKGAITFLDNTMYDIDYYNLSFTINNYSGSFKLLENEKYLLNWLSEYNREGAVYLTTLKKKAGNGEFINKYAKWRNLVLQETSEFNFYTSIKRKKILTNEYEDERRKWVAFKKYLQDSGNSEILSLKELGLWDSIIPYAMALNVAENLLQFVQKNDTSYNDTNNIFMNYLFLHYYTSTYRNDFDKSYSSAVNDSSSGNFSGGGGGDFGGGGGSSAF
jgi:uncharacterized membrane protein